jgi:large subunit ribosomal protein L17
MLACIPPLAVSFCGFAMLFSTRGSNMVTSLIEHERIKTTVPKAKEVRRLADQMVTYAKKNTLESRRAAAAFVRSGTAVDKLFDTLRKRYE